MITIYLYENKIQYKEKEEIKEHTVPKKAMKYGKVINSSLFEKEIEKLIKKEKWSTLLYSKKIKIILPIHYEELDKEILTHIFYNFGLKHITYKKESTLFELKNNVEIINIHKSYCTILKKVDKKIEKTFLPINFFKTTENMINFMIKKNEKNKYYFLGSNKEIEKIIKKMNNNKLYYFNKKNTYIIEKVIP